MSKRVSSTKSPPVEAYKMPMFPAPGFWLVSGSSSKRMYAPSDTCPQQLANLLRSPEMYDRIEKYLTYRHKKSIDESIQVYPGGFRYIRPTWSDVISGLVAFLTKTPDEQEEELTKLSKTVHFDPSTNTIRHVDGTPIRSHFEETQLCQAIRYHEQELNRFRELLTELQISNL